VCEDKARTSIAEYGDSIDAEAIARSNHAARNLATVSNEHLLEGLSSAHIDTMISKRRKLLYEEKLNVSAEERKQKKL